MTLSFSPEAEDDLVAIVSYLAERNPIAARELVERIFAVVDRLCARDFPRPSSPASRSAADRAADGRKRDVAHRLGDSIGSRRRAASLPIAGGLTS